MSEPFAYDDTTEDARLVIERNSLGITVSTTDAVIIPPHDLARVVGAMYERIGHAVPDLPLILHPQQVDELARVLHEHAFGSGSQAPDDVHRDYARAALAAGWRKP